MYRPLFSSASHLRLHYSLFACTVPALLYDQVAGTAHQAHVHAIDRNFHRVGAPRADLDGVLTLPGASIAFGEGAAKLLHSIHKHTHPRITRGVHLHSDVG